MISEIQRQKRRARAKTNYFIRTGILKRRPCDVCGIRLKVEAHHITYDNPFAVRWLCKGCHVSVHTDLRHANTIHKQLAFKLEKQLRLL